jgi:PAS domain S-box-containing protein
VTTKREEDELLRSAAPQTANSILIARRPAEQRSEFYLAEGQRLAHMGSWALSPAGRFDYWSPELFQIYGLDPAKGAPTLDEYLAGVHPQDRAVIAECLERMLRDRTGCDVKQRIVRPDGEVRHVRWVGVPDVDDEIFRGFVGTALDVTDQEHLIRELRKSEAELRQLIDIVPDFIFILAPDGTRLYANKRLLDYHGAGVSLETYRDATTIADYCHPDDLEQFVHERRQGLVRGAPFEIEGRQRGHDGNHRWFLFRYNPLRDEDGRILRWYGTATDIDDRKRTEQTLRRIEAYLAEAQRLGRTGSFAWNVRRREYVYWSAELYRIFGRDPAEGLPSFQSALDQFHPEDWSRVFEARQKAIREKTDYNYEIRLVTPNGDFKHLRVAGHPVVDDAGDVVELIGAAMDITAAKCAEEALRQAQADLAHVNRVTTMGELTASLGHEVNQPIAAAVTNANACLRWLTGDPPNLEEARASALSMVKDGMRAAEIISRIRLLFKKGAPQRELVDATELIREMIVLLRGELTRYAVSVRTELAADLPQLMADRVQVQQVLMNLILNGIDAMKDVDGTRELTIKSQRTENEELMLSVSDTGVGLPQQPDQIFNAFFTTKPHGTGMGLSISRSIVEAHGGRLRAADNSPRGATFHLFLPTKVEAPEWRP